MRTLFLFLFIFYANETILIAQQDTINSIPLVSYWEKGESYDFKVTKIKKRWTDGELIKNDSSSYISSFEVVDSTENSYTINWSYKTSLTEYNIPDSFLEALEEYEDTKLIYTTDEVGSFNQIENWEEISDMMTAMLDEVVRQLKKENKDTSVDIEKSMQPILQIYSSREGIESLVFKELHYLHFPFGVEYTINDTIEYVDQLPNFVGGNPIRGDTELYISDIDTANYIFTLNQDMKLNEDDMKSLLSSFFKQMNLDEQEFEEALKEATYNVNDTNKYTYEYYKGVPLQIETNRTLIMDIGGENGKLIEIVRIELME